MGVLNRVLKYKNLKPILGLNFTKIIKNAFIDNVSQSDGDFIIDDKYIIEVGGKSKDKKQIKNVDNSFLAIDDIESGYDNSIPLWLFGFLY